jgi:ribosomal protein L9
VTAQDIADAIQEARGILVDRRNVRLEEPIKSVGTRIVEVAPTPPPSGKSPCATTYKQ